MDWEHLSYAEKKRIRTAIGIFSPAVFVPVACIVLALLYVQLFQSVYFRRKAEENRTRTIVKLAPRGVIFDRTGRIIADSRPRVKALYYPFEVRDLRTVQLIGDLFPEMKQKLAGALSARQVAPLCDELTREQLFTVLSLRHRIPGIAVVTEYRRFYPDANVFAHVLGYVSAITPQEFRRRKNDNYSIQDYTGKSGIEHTYEPYLRGLYGAVVTEIDARGMALRVVRDYEPAPGYAVHTTLDSRLQHAARAMLASSGYRGAVVGIDPRDGAVRVLVSYPDFDPNEFMKSGGRHTGRIPGAAEDRPEFNRATMGAYAPGSIVKPVFLLAGLEERRIVPDHRVECAGGVPVGNRFFRCWHRSGHGWIGAQEAVQESCDVFFYRLGLSLGPDILEYWIRAFGAGVKTGIDLPSEAAGVCPGRRWKQAHRKTPWFDGDTANMSIGQGYLTMSAVQMAAMAAALANRGTLWRPFVVERVVDRRGEVVLRNSAERIRSIKAEEHHWHLVEQSMVRVIDRGTGVAAHISGVVLAGKTGTAQNPHGPDHALFICYGPLNGERPPELALAVVVEHGLRGGGIAARIARVIFRTLVDGSYRADQLPPQDPGERAYGD